MILARSHALYALPCAVALLLCRPAAALDFNFFRGEEEQEEFSVLWEDPPQYVRIEQREPEAAPNQHPVQLDAHSLQRVFAALRVQHRSKGFFGFGSGEGDPIPLFTSRMAELLAGQAVGALAGLGPDQELTFVLFGYYGGRFFSDKQAIAGRLFYVDNRLHLLLGDLHRSVRTTGGRDVRGLEHEVDLRRYPYKVGHRRADPGEDWLVVPGAGLDLHRAGGRQRYDWLELEPAVFLAALPEGPPVTAVGAAPATTVAGRAAAVPAAARPATGELQRLREESRRLRVEFARLRKYLEERDRGDRGAGAHAQSAELVEQRLLLLEQLRAKELISEQEYRDKRAGLLDKL